MTKIKISDLEIAWTNSNANAMRIKDTCSHISDPLETSFGQQAHALNEMTSSLLPGQIEDEVARECIIKALDSILELTSQRLVEGNEDEFENVNEHVLEIENEPLLSDLEDDGMLECDLEAFTFEEEIIEPTLVEGHLEFENEKNSTLDEVKDNEEEIQVMDFIEIILVRISTFHSLWIL